MSRKASITILVVSTCVLIVAGEFLGSVKDAKRRAAAVEKCMHSVFASALTEIKSYVADAKNQVFLSASYRDEDLDRLMKSLNVEQYLTVANMAEFLEKGPGDLPMAFTKLDLVSAEEMETGFACYGGAASGMSRKVFVVPNARKILIYCVALN